MLDGWLCWGWTWNRNWNWNWMSFIEMKMAAGDDFKDD